VNEPAALVAKKIVNALIPTAQPRFPVGKQVGFVLERFRAKYQGLWVGGTLYLLPDCLDFQPNAVNRFVHNADVSRRVALADIASVSDQFGVVTRIVTVTLRDGTDFKFRCFGAPKFVQKIRAQMQLV
jgi:hypothetical protein